MATILEAPPQLQITETAEVRPGIIIPVTHVPQESAETLQQRKDVKRAVDAMSKEYAKRLYLRCIKDISSRVHTSKRFDEQSLLLNIAHYPLAMVVTALRTKIDEKTRKILDSEAERVGVFG